MDDPSHAHGAGMPANTSALDKSSDRTAALLTAIALMVSAAVAALSPDGILQFDDLTHFLYAKWAWTWPLYLLDEWGRPGFTALYFLPAKFGWPMCRVLSSILSAWSAWFAYRIACQLGMRRPWAVIALAWAQPLFFQLSMTTLTETALALYLTGAVYLAVTQRWTLSAAVLSIAFVTRHEAILFLPIWIAAAWLAGTNVWRLWPILWAPLATNGLAVLIGARSAFERLLEPRPSNQYGQGGWLTFFSRSMEAFGPAISVLSIVGLRGIFRQANAGSISNDRGPETEFQCSQAVADAKESLESDVTNTMPYASASAREALPSWRDTLAIRWRTLLVVSCVVAYFAAQTVIRALGLFDSGGYARFLVPISPLVAILALAGWRELSCADVRVRSRAVLLAAVAMILLLVAMERQMQLFAEARDIAAELPEVQQARIAVRVAAAIIVVAALVWVAALWNRPDHFLSRRLLPGLLATLILLTMHALHHRLWPPEEAYLIHNARATLNSTGYRGREIVSANVWIDYVTDRRMPPIRPTVREQIERAPIGTLFAWERQFAGCPDHKLGLGEFLGSDAFRLIHQTEPLRFRREPYLWVFEKVAPWGSETIPSTQSK